MARPGEEEDQTVDPAIVLPGNENVTLFEDDAVPPDDDDEPEVRATPARDKAGKWTDKKATRQNAIRDNEEFRNTAKELRETVKALEERSSRQMTELIAALRPAPAAQGPAPEVTRIETDIATVTEAMKAALGDISRDVPGAEDKYYKLQDRRTELIADRRALTQGWGKQVPQQQQPGMSPSEAAEYVQIQAEFPELDGNEKWSKVAGAFRTGLLRAGHPPNIATTRLAIQQAAQQLGIASRAQAPSQRTRQAYGAPAGAGRTPNGKAARTMQIPRNLIAGSGLTEAQVAEALFSDSDE